MGSLFLSPPLPLRLALSPEDSGGEGREEGRMRRRDKESCQLICRYKSERSRWEEERTSFYLFSDHFFPSFFAFLFSSSPRAPPSPPIRDATAALVSPAVVCRGPQVRRRGVGAGSGGWPFGGDGEGWGREGERKSEGGGKGGEEWKGGEGDRKGRREGKVKWRGGEGRDTRGECG